MKFAAAAILLLSLFNLDTAIALTGSQWTVGNILHSSFCVISYCDNPPLSPVTDATITFTSSGYTPDALAVKAGNKITLHLVNKGATNCVQAFTIPFLNLQKVVPINSSDTLVFTAPAKPGSFSFMCSQGLHPGTIEVI